MKRGRKSASELSIVTALDDRIGKPPPLSGLTAEQADEWRSIVAAMPADWFSREAFAIFAANCRHSCRSRFLSRRLDSMKLDDLDDLVAWDKLATAVEREWLARDLARLAAAVPEAGRR